jgi:hypothetical protein
MGALLPEQHGVTPRIYHCVFELKLEEYRPLAAITRPAQMACRQWAIRLPGFHRK